MILRLYLDRSYDLTILSEGFSFNSVCGEAGKHAVSSVNVQVRPFKDGVNVANKIINSDNLIKAEIIDSSALFTGVIRPYLNTSSMNAYAENLSLEIMDNTETMHIYVYDPSVEGVKEGRIYPSVKKNILMRDLVEWLFSLCNLSVDASSIPADETVPYFKLSSGGYVDEVIEGFLFEYGYDYRFDNTGKAVIFHTYLDDVSIRGEIKDTINSISLSRSDDTSDGLNVTYKKYAYAINKRILNFSTGNMGFNKWGIIAQNLQGKLYSGFMHDQHFNPNSSMPDGNLWNWNFENCGVMIDGGRKLTASDVLFVDTDISKCKVNLYDEVGVDYSIVLDSYDENGCRMWVDYNGRFNVNLDFENGWAGWDWSIEVYGNIGYAMFEDYSYSINGPNPESLKFEYYMVGSDDSIKETVVKKYYTRQKLSKVTYEFQSLSRYEVGDFYTLVDPVSGRSQDVRLISRKKGNDNIYTYRAEGAGKIADYPVEIKNESKSYSASTSNGMSAYEIAVENGFIGTEEEWQASLSAKDFSSVFSPAVYNIEPRKGGTSNIVCTITRINSLAGSVSASIYSGASGFALSADGDIITITYANNVSTSTSFKIDVTVGDITKTYILNGIMKDSAPKNLGWFEALPDESTAPEKFIEGDCILIQGVPYKYIGNTWTQLDNINSLDISMAMSLVDTAMSHVNVEEQSMAAVYGFIKNLFSQNAIIDFIKTRTIEMQSGGIIKSKGVSDSDIDDKFLPTTGFAFDGDNGRLQANKAYIQNAIMRLVEMNGSDIMFGSRGRFYSSVSWPQVSLSAWQLMMFCYMVWPESPYQPKSFSGTATVNGYSVTNGYVTLDPLNIAIKFYTSSPTSSTATPYIQVRGNEGNSKSYVSINGGSESEITSGDIQISFIADSPACVKTLQPWSARNDGFSASTIGSPMHPMDSVISRLGVFSDIRLGGTGVLTDGSYYIDNKMQEGSTRLSGGIIIKWAKLAATGGGAADWRVWNYAWPFPNNCIMAFSFIEKSDQARDDYAYGYPMFFSGQQAVFSSWGAFNSYAIALGY